MLLTATCAISFAQTDEPVFRSRLHSFRLSTLIDGLEHPWSLAFLPDGRALITERPGRLQLVAPGDGGRGKWKKSGVVKALPKVAALGQGGLFDVAIHPDFAENRWVYLAYNGPDGNGKMGTELVRARLDGLTLRDKQPLFSMNPKSFGGRHFGGRIVFDRRRLLYLSLGDRGKRSRAQDLHDHAGSVIRLHADGRVPADNPFADHPARGLPEIFTIGHRNPQGMAIHPDTGELWLHEHGPQGGDEVNLIKKRHNYGWPVITYGVNYVIGTKIGEGTHKKGMEQPLYKWVPSIAPSGMAFYQADAFAQWRGSLFVGALRGQMLVRLGLEGARIVEEERLLKNETGRIRDVRVGPDGLIYLLQDASPGKLLRLEPLSASQN